MVLNAWQMDKELTIEDFKEKVRDGSIIGVTIKIVYKDKVNKTYPVYMQFTGFSGNNRFKYINYDLLNENTEEYKVSKPFQYIYGNFINSFDLDVIDSITIVDGIPRQVAIWEV